MESYLGDGKVIKETISKKEVEHVALLAHIELTEDEKELFTKQFNRILEYFRKIDDAALVFELRFEEVEPTFHVLDIYNVFRKDEISEHLTQEEALTNAPRKEQGYVKAPKII